MKKLKSTIPNGGAPLGEFPVLRELFNVEIWDAMEAILNSVTDGQTEGVILSGCEVTGAGPYDISAGLVYLDGEILRFDAVTGQTLTKYIRKATVTSEGGQFADGATKDYIDVHKASLQSTTGSGVQYITMTSAGGRRLDDRIGDIINDGVVTAAKIASGAVTTSKISDLNVTTVKIAANAVTSDKIEVQQAWQNLTLLNSWVTSGAATHATPPTPGYYKDSLGRVHLRGVVDNGTSTTIATLPVGYRPDANFNAGWLNSAGNSTIRVLTDGSIQGDDAGGYVILDGISFRAA